MKILIVDDSRVMRQIVTRTLRQAGYRGHELLEATNGYEGLQAVKEHGPDLVLSDWNMPEMSGIELLQALRAQDLMVPFGFITSERSPEVRARAADAGALFLITKPFDAETVRDALDPVMV